MKNLVFILLFLTMGCQIPGEQTQIGEMPNHCFSPTDAIYKFEQFRADLLREKIKKFLVDHKITLNSGDQPAIDKWITQEVFASIPLSYRMVVEWNIDDDDFCKIRKTIFQNIQSGKTDTMSIRICNSVTNDGIIFREPGDLEIQQKQATLRIVHCSKIVNTLKKVGYYEVRKSENGLEYSFSDYKLKHLVKADVYLIFENRQTRITEKIYSDRAFLYSDLLNFGPDDYE